MLQRRIFVSKYMVVIVAMDGVELGMHGVHYSFLTLNMQSAKYLRMSSIIIDCTSFYVVAFSVSAACATLIPHHSFKYYGVVFKRRSDDKKGRGCLMLVGLFGVSGTVSM